MRERPGLEEIRRVQDEAEPIHSREVVEKALDRMASELEGRLSRRNPLLLGVMVGGVVPLGALLSRLRFPLEVDYLHATRYRGNTSGGALEWLARPMTPLSGRVVLVVDDILDEGTTLAHILADCRARGASEVFSAVLVEKRHDRKPLMEHADFSGVEVEDRYVFGFGMDYRGYLRNADGIYAVKGL